jgi:NAD(P)-dependent dehydrogenase (short-subunit alcohol dehydrogenase family)
MLELKDKVVLITGARRGMGKADALLMAKAGAKVVLADISQEECQVVADEIKKAGGQALALKCDVTDKKCVTETVEKTVKEFGRIDVLVNNAGICQFKPFLDMTEEEWDKIIEVNLKGYFLCAQAAAKEMAKQKSGVIVNIASIVMGQIGKGMGGLAHYSASKGGIAALTKTLAIELAPYNIRVNAIAPGAIDTPMASSTKMDPETMAAILAPIPMKRMGRAEEIASTVLFLASDASSYITGSIVVVDGGWLAT